MKRQRSQSAISTRRVKPKLQRQDATVSAVVRKELRKKADWKYTDISAVALNMTTTGAVVSLLGSLIRGDAGINNFDGNTINPQAITFKYYAHTSELRNTFRVMIFQWFDAAVPSLTSVLQTAAASVATIAPILLQAKSNIKVLYDHTHQMAPSAADGGVVYGEGIISPITVYIPGKRLRPVRYNQSTNTVSNGNIYLLYVSDDSVIPAPQITFYSRVTFTDQ